MSDDLLNIEYLLDRPIAYHRVFVDVTGSVFSAIFLSQAVYWQRRVPQGRDGWYYKSQAEWREETGLTRNQIQSAKTALEALGVMEFRLHGFPRRTWYRLNVERLKEIILYCRSRLNSTSSSLQESTSSSSQESTNSSLQESTSSSLQESTNSSLQDSINSGISSPTPSLSDSTSCNLLNSTYSLQESTKSSLQDSTYCSLLDSTDQFARNQQADLTEITNNKTKKHNFADFVPVDNFLPTEHDRTHFENLALRESFDLIVMEFRLYHRDLSTPAMNAMAWSKLLRGWCNVRAHGLPEHPATTGRHFGEGHEQN